MAFFKGVNLDEIVTIKQNSLSLCTGQKMRIIGISKHSDYPFKCIDENQRKMELVKPITNINQDLIEYHLVREDFFTDKEFKKNQKAKAIDIIKHLEGNTAILAMVLERLDLPSEIRQVIQDRIVSNNIEINSFKKNGN